MELIIWFWSITRNLYDTGGYIERTVPAKKILLGRGE
jgi:hypothetical protein